MPRTRGAVSGLLLVILGAWGALIPFVGPYFNFAYTPDHEWTWTAAWGWLEVFPVVSGLGALIVFLGGGILARLSIRAACDVEFATVPTPDVSPPEVSPEVITASASRS